MNDGKTLYDSHFVAEYLSSLKKSLDNELTAPRLILNELVLVMDSKYAGKFIDKVRNSLRASSIWSSEGAWSDDRFLKNYQEKTNLSALIIVHPSNLNQLRDKNILSRSDYDKIKAQYKKNQQVIYSFKKTPSVPGYIILAQNYENTVDLVERIGSLKQGFDGAYDGL